jgi:hypothetical protein
VASAYLVEIDLRMGIPVAAVPVNDENTELFVVLRAGMNPVLRE